jgi:hypothetical protein
LKPNFGKVLSHDAQIIFFHFRKYIRSNPAPWIIPIVPSTPKKKEQQPKKVELDPSQFVGDDSSDIAMTYYKGPAPPVPSAYGSCDFPHK